MEYKKTLVRNNSGTNRNQRLIPDERPFLIILYSFNARRCGAASLPAYCWRFAVHA